MRTTRTAASFAAALALLTRGADPAMAVAELPHRAESTAVHAVAGHWVNPVKGYLGGDWLLFHRGDTVTLQGQGYFLVRWEIEYWRGTGVVSMPTFAGQQGIFLHVASAGHRMDAPVTGGEPGQTWMGKPSVGFETLPTGTPMIWVNEYYYVDGTITITCQEAEDGKNGRYNLGIAPKSWQQVDSDVHPPGNGTVGMVTDPGTVTSPSVSPSVSVSPGSPPTSGQSTAPQTATTAPASGKSNAPRPPTTTPSTTDPVATDPTTAGTSTATGSAAAEGSASTAGSLQDSHVAQTKASPVGPELTAAGLALVALGGGALWWRRRRSDDADERAPSR